MAAKADDPRKSLFSFKRTYNSSSSDPPGGPAPTDSTSAEDAHSIFNRKDGLHNFGIALELLIFVGDGNDLLPPLKAVCEGLKVLVDTAEAIQTNNEDLRGLNTMLQLQLEALEPQDKRLSASDLNFVHKEVEYFANSLRMYILDLDKVQRLLDILHHKEGGSAKKFFKKALMGSSVPEEIEVCSWQLKESFQLFMNSVTIFIAHQAMRLRNDTAEIRLRAEPNDALAQLPCSDAAGNQHDSCLEGTRDDIIKEIMEWATNPADKPVFCLADQVGTGKSTISAHMAQRWEKEGLLIGRFFFSVLNSVTNANELPTTLARDMANSGPSLRSLILDAIDDHPNIAGHSIKDKIEWFVFTPLMRWRDGFAKGLEEVRKKMQEKSYSQGLENIHPEIVKQSDIKAFEVSYRQALGQARKEPENGSCKEVLAEAYVAYMEALEKAYMVALARSPIIVIDALDECGIVDRGILLKSILCFLEEASLIDSHPLKLFLACRPEQDIVSHIQEPCQNSLVRQADFGMRSLKNSSDHDDIYLYAKKYLGQVLSIAEIDLFVIRANGLFIWASTARTFLADALDPSARFQELLAPNNERSPLDSLYDKVLRSAIDRIEHGQVGLLRNVLHAICVAREPLSTRAIEELLGLGNGLARRVVNMLKSVLSEGTDDKVVQVLHPTFIEYFRAGSQPNDLLFSDGEAETLLARGCLNVLSSPQLRFDICGIMGPNSFAPKNKDIDDLQQRLEENVGPGLKYAAVHGLSHVALCLGNRTVLTRLREFFTSKLLYWIELMSLIERVYHLMQSIHHLRGHIEDGMVVQSMELLCTADKDWCEEIQRLVQPFQGAIEKSALQVYFSALPSAPLTSRISHFYRQIFIERNPEVLSVAWRANSQCIVLSGHTLDITCISFSPDGRTLASGSCDHTVRLWDVGTGAAISEPLTGHTGGVIGLSFSSDGRSFASGSYDRTVRLWDAITGATIGEPLTGHGSDFTCLSFSPDGRSFASGSQDSTVRIWDSKTGTAVGEPLAGHTGDIICLSFSPDGQNLASGSGDHTVRLWDAITGGVVGKPLTGHTKRVDCLSFSPDGRRLASGSQDSTVRLWDVATGAAIGEPLTGHTDGVISLSFSPDGRGFASGSQDSMVRIWDSTTGTAVGEPLAGHAGDIICLSFSPDGRHLASGSQDSTVRLWDATTDAAIGEGSETASSVAENGQKDSMFDYQQSWHLPVPGDSHGMHTTSISRSAGLTQARSPGPVGQFQNRLVKPLMSFLTIPYLRARRILHLARTVNSFHMQSIYLSRQALHLVILLNDVVDAAEGPDDEQYEERNDLADELIELADAMRDWGANYGGDGTIDYEQQVLKIKRWHIRLFRERFYFPNARDSAADSIYQKLLAYDERTIWFRKRREEGDPNRTGVNITHPNARSETPARHTGAFITSGGSTATSLDLQWLSHPGCDIRNSTVANVHWKTTALVDMYKFVTPEDAAHEMPLTKILRLNYVSEQYEEVALIEWSTVASESLVKFLTSETHASVSDLRQKYPERPNSRSRYFSAGDSHYKWTPVERRKEDLLCVQSVYPNRDVCLYEGTTNRLRITAEGQHVLDQVIVTLLLNLYFRETNMW